ncbi:MAG: phosphatidylserine decarboxylase [Gammaproteobacteria bacterium]|nr:phosphatidylserine decarboxylase [Gammaproteobacteria bacterium]MCP5135581.1 phosphatidylserine decarboxylase [Gammaproteobacteria bacterium]
MNSGQPLAPSPAPRNATRSHQYIDRRTGQVLDEHLYADRLIQFLYSTAREHSPNVFRMLTGPRMSGLLGYLNYDLMLGARLTGNQRFLRKLGIDLGECLDAAQLTTARAIFERRIRYWDVRPMPVDNRIVVSPADARVLVGSLNQHSRFFIKEKFFHFEELLGPHKRNWLERLSGGEFAVFRLTPDKYHYNHCPVSGQVVDFYTVSGRHHACNPNAVVHIATPYSKNERVVTVIDTDVPGGSQVGVVAMIEVVALMIGQVVQTYSEHAYERPVTMRRGLFLRRGQPKSLYRPGSSTDVLLFEPDRIRFDGDLLRNRLHRTATSRFSLGFAENLVETDIAVRASLARRLGD